MRLTAGSYVSLFGDSGVTPRPSFGSVCACPSPDVGADVAAVRAPRVAVSGSGGRSRKDQRPPTPRGGPIVGLALPEMDKAGAPGLNGLAAPQAPAVDEVSWTVHFSGAAAAEA